MFLRSWTWNGNRGKRDYKLNSTTLPVYSHHLVCVCVCSRWMDVQSHVCPFRVSWVQSYRLVVNRGRERKWDRGRYRFIEKTCKLSGKADSECLPWASVFHRVPDTIDLAMKVVEWSTKAKHQSLHGTISSATSSSYYVIHGMDLYGIVLVT